MKIVNLQERLQEATLNIVVYGQAGAGKTSLIKTLPGRVLVVSAEAGLLSLRGFDADVAEVATVDDLRAVHGVLAKGGHGYDWVAVDSLSEIAELVLAAEKAKTPDPRKAYGTLVDQMMAVCRAFRELPINVYMSAKAERVKDEGTGRLMEVLSMPGAKLSNQIPYLFDEIFSLAVGKDRDSGEIIRMLQTAPEPTSDAKDRSGRLDQYEPADLGAVVSKIKGE